MSCLFPTQCSLCKPPSRPLDQHTSIALCLSGFAFSFSSRFSFLFARKLHLIVDGCKPKPLYRAHVCVCLCWVKRKAVKLLANGAQLLKNWRAATVTDAASYELETSCANRVARCLSSAIKDAQALPDTQNGNRSGFSFKFKQNEACFLFTLFPFLFAILHFPVATSREALCRWH